MRLLVQIRAKTRCLGLNEALAMMGLGKFHLSLVLLDCCRNWPFTGLRKSNPIDPAAFDSCGGV